MRCWSSVAMALVLALLAGAAAMADGDPFGADWPEGPNRAVTGAFCGSCHSLSLVTQQRQSRAGWDKLMTWMSETQHMPVPAPALRTMMLDYLEFSFGLDSASGQARRPALDATAGGQQGADLPPLLQGE